jgi:hypothetical protein
VQYVVDPERGAVPPPVHTDPLDRGAAGQPLPGRGDVVEPVGEVQIRPDQRGGHDSAGVDHGVVRQPPRVERQLVERLPTRLAPDVAMHCVDAVLIERQAVTHGLGHRLRAKRDMGISDGEALPVHGADSDCQLLRVDAAKLRNVVSDGS